MTAEPPIAESFVLICERCGRVFGAPFPKRLLEIGNPTDGWGVRLNPTDAAIGDVEPFRAYVTFNGWPAGIIDPYGGCLIAVVDKTEDALCKWLRSDLVTELPNETQTNQTPAQPTSAL